METPSNLLLERLPRRDRRYVLALCEPVALHSSEPLCEPGEAMRHVYFPTAGRISLIARMPGQAGVEVGMVGREGMLGVQLILGVAVPPWQAQVHGSGTAWRASTADLRRMLTRSAAFRRKLGRYLCVQMAQMTIAPVCQRFHLIGSRSARWLLMSQDRARSDRFHVTQQTLAALLGVRRVGVTLAAGDMQRQGLIAYHRGEITVLDREGLKALACACYRFDSAAYANLLG